MAATHAPQLVHRGSKRVATSTPPPPAPPAVETRPRMVIDEQDLAELAADGPIRLDAGSALISEGDAVDSVYLIRSGEVEVYRRNRGRRTVMQIMRKGDLLGLVAHLRGTPTRYNARAITPVQLIRLRPEALTWLLQARPTMSRRFLVYMAGMLERMGRRVEELSGAGLRARVAVLLLDETGGGPGTIRLPQSTLADLLGASRSSVNRILKELEADGLLKVRYRQVHVVDAAAVRRLIR
jgi:CRP-like cAMP-binding protein